MPLAILHYHLSPGGVTQVIGHHLRALAACGAVNANGEGDAARGGPIVVLHGGRQEGWTYQSGVTGGPLQGEVKCQVFK